MMLSWQSSHLLYFVVVHKREFNYQHLATNPIYYNSCKSSHAMIFVQEKYLVILNYIIHKLALTSMNSVSILIHPLQRRMHNW